MLTIERILCAVELRLDEIQVLACACAIARPFHARVDALLMLPGEEHVVRPSNARADLTPELDVNREAELLFATLLGRVGDNRVNPKVVGCDPRAVLEQSVECDSDLIVVAPKPAVANDTRGPSLTDELARRTTRPVLTVPSGAGASINRILLPVDFSPATPRAVEWASLLARQFRASVRVLHAVGSTALRGEPVLRGESVPKDFERARALVGEIEQGLRSTGIECESAIAERGTIHAILACSEHEKSDLIVMGMHPHDDERTAASGMVSSIRRRAQVPLLSITMPELAEQFTLAEPVRDGESAGHGNGLSDRAKQHVASPS